ncbi:MAG: polyhydroxybutyrate depolymerase [Oleispira sp.]|jgi:polyhydroxybutyrate depolymerase
MMRRLLIGLSFVATLFIGLGIYYLYAPSAKAPLETVEKFTIDFENRIRSYSVYYPDNLKPGANVLFALHPSMSSGREMRSWVGHTLERFAAIENTVVVYPDGYEGHFNGCRKIAPYSARTLNIDDVGFIRLITNQLVTNKLVSADHIYAMGYSNGGHLAFRIAMEAPGLVQGIAVIAANLPTPDNMACNYLGSLPRVVSLVMGTEDPINPYEGGKVTLFGFGNRGGVLSAYESAQWFADALGVTSSSTATTIKVAGSQVERKSWQSSDAHISLMTIVGGGHTVPQAHFRFRRILGLTLESDSVLDSVMQLFKTDMQKE